MKTHSKFTCKREALVAAIRNVDYSTRPSYNDSSQYPFVLFPGAVMELVTLGACMLPDTILGMDLHACV